MFIMKQYYYVNIINKYSIFINYLIIILILNIKYYINIIKYSFNIF